MCDDAWDWMEAMLADRWMEKQWKFKTRKQGIDYYGWMFRLRLPDEEYDARGLTRKP